MGAIAAAALLHKQREIVAAFRAAGATSAANGKTAGGLGIHDGVAFERLRRRAVLRDAANGAFYLDEPSWEALCALRRRLSLILVGIALAAGLAAFLLVGRS
jgi:hypothetical protein